MSNSILAAISPLVADDLDALLENDDNRRAARMGKAIMPEVRPHLLTAGYRNEQTVCIGVHLKEAPEFPSRLALKLATVSAQNNVEVIILSEPEYSRLEPYGFRTERVCGSTKVEKEACLKQLSSFWMLQVVLTV